MSLLGVLNPVSLGDEERHSSPEVCINVILRSPRIKLAWTEKLFRYLSCYLHRRWKKKLWLVALSVTSMVAFGFLPQILCKVILTYKWYFVSL